MYNQQGFDANTKGGCGRGPWGRGKFSGPWGGHKFGGFWDQHGGRFGGFPPVPVNIEETNDQYTISLYAAGIVKENVKMTVKDDVLTVAYPGTETAAESGNQPNYTHQEYGNRPFERSFQLNNKVLVESISATYADGILNVVLPKNPETTKPAQTITVS